MNERGKCILEKVSFPQKILSVKSYSAIRKEKLHQTALKTIFLIRRKEQKMVF
jgi:hypothetical protein